MSKCECCKEENSDLITYKGYKMCPTCYMGYVRKVKVCENNAKYETEINQLKQQLAIKDKMINLIWIDLFHLNNDNNDWTISVAQYQKEAIEKLKEGDTNE